MVVTAQLQQRIAAQRGEIQQAREAGAVAKKQIISEQAARLMPGLAGMRQRSAIGQQVGEYQQKVEAVSGEFEAQAQPIERQISEYESAVKENQLWKEAAMWAERGVNPANLPPEIAGKVREIYKGESNLPLQTALKAGTIPPAVQKAIDAMTKKGISEENAFLNVGIQLTKPEAVKPEYVTPKDLFRVGNIVETPFKTEGTGTGQTLDLMKLTPAQATDIGAYVPTATLQQLLARPQTFEEKLAAPGVTLPKAIGLTAEEIITLPKRATYGAGSFIAYDILGLQKQKYGLIESPKQEYAQRGTMVLTKEGFKPQIMAEPRTFQMGYIPTKTEKALQAISTGVEIGTYILAPTKIITPLLATSGVSKISRGEYLAGGADILGAALPAITRRLPRDKIIVTTKELKISPKEAVMGLGRPTVEISGGLMKSTYPIVTLSPGRLASTGRIVKVEYQSPFRQFVGKLTEGRFGKPITIYEGTPYGKGLGSYKKATELLASSDYMQQVGTWKILGSQRVQIAGAGKISKVKLTSKNIKDILKFQAPRFIEPKFTGTAQVLYGATKEPQIAILGKYTAMPKKIIESGIRTRGGIGTVDYVSQFGFRVAEKEGSIFYRTYPEFTRAYRTEKGAEFSRLAQAGKTKTLYEQLSVAKKKGEGMLNVPSGIEGIYRKEPVEVYKTADISQKIIPKSRRLYYSKGKLITSTKEPIWTIIYPESNIKTIQAKPEFITSYHGTSDVFLKDILKGGLKGKERGFVSTALTPEEARGFAGRKTIGGIGAVGGKPVVLEVKIPKSEAGKLGISSEKLSGISSELRWKQIPSKYIKEYKPTISNIKKPEIKSISKQEAVSLLKQTKENIVIPSFKYEVPALTKAKIKLKPETATKFKTLYMTAQKQKVSQQSVQKLVSSQKVTPIEKSKISTKLIERTTPIERVAQLEKVAPIEKLATIQKVKLIEKIIQKTKPTAPKTSPKIIETIKPKPSSTIRKAPQPKMIEKAALFKILGKRFGKEIKLGEAETQTEAETKLKKFLKTTLGRSGRILKGERALKTYELKTFSPVEFRPAKREATRIVQRSKFALGRQGEIQEIMAFRKMKSRGGRRLKLW